MGGLRRDATANVGDLRLRSSRKLKPARLLHAGFCGWRPSTPSGPQRHTTASCRASSVRCEPCCWLCTTPGRTAAAGAARRSDCQHCRPICCSASRAWQPTRCQPGRPERRGDGRHLRRIVRRFIISACLCSRFCSLLVEKLLIIRICVLCPGRCKPVAARHMGHASGGRHGGGGGWPCEPQSLARLLLTCCLFLPHCPCNASLLGCQRAQLSVGYRAATPTASGLSGCNKLGGIQWRLGRGPALPRSAAMHQLQLLVNLRARQQ